MQAVTDPSPRWMRHAQRLPSHRVHVADVAPDDRLERLLMLCSALGVAAYRVGRLGLWWRFRPVSRRGYRHVIETTEPATVTVDQLWTLSHG